jgi:hypothetical protein
VAGASLNDLSRAGFRQYSRVAPTDIDIAEIPGKPPRSDIGTIVIHWTASIACIITLVTGLRLASDQEFSLVWRAIARVLPQGEIWSWHIISGLALYFASTAYAVYIHRSGLKRRIALAKVRALTLPTPRKTKWGAVNVLLHWALYGLLLTQTVTGFLLYLGHGGWWVTIHSFAATAVLIYIVAHTVAHFGYGGLQQLLRLFRPSPLVKNKATRSRPLLIAASVGSVVAASLVLADYGTLDKLTIRSIPAADAPALDGVLDEAIWKTARPVHVRTMQGSGLGGLGESTVEIRAVRDDRKVHFAFRWEDPSRSLRRVPMIKKEDGWHVLGNRVDNADVTDFYEDKFAILISKHDGFGNAGSTHMGRTPLSDKKLPAAVNERGLHYTTDGSFLDVWQWKASRGGGLGVVDDQYFGPPRDATPGEASGKARYQGGYWNDPGRAFYSYNYKIDVGHRGPVPQLSRLPKDLAATVAALGKFDLNPDSSDEEGARWWMTEAETVPYSKELDEKIPVGTVLPGVLIMGNYEGDRANLRGGAKWKDGYWTLEVSRDLATASRFDIDFVPGQDLFFWVSVFDHNQTRHTRHMRPVKIVMH